jgi:hypothetical protein
MLRIVDAFDDSVVGLICLPSRHKLQENPLRLKHD